MPPEIFSMSDVTVIREQFSHMGGHSGYDLLCPALEESGVSVCSVWRQTSLPSSSFMRGIVDYAWAKLPNKSSFYRQLNLWTELCALKKTVLSSGSVHILYGENNLGLFALPLIKGTSKLVVTAHQPFSWWLEQGLDVKRKFACVDALIVLSRSEKEHFENLLGKKKVYYVPHGVDTEFFCPDVKGAAELKRNRPVKRYLFVGQWLRSFETLFSVIEMSADKKSNVEFDLVVPDLSFRDSKLEEGIRRVSGLPQVTRHQCLDDRSLRELYRKATLLLMPLEESTANNAILEAMASGLPIVTSATNGIMDYVDRSFARICPLGDASAMNDALDQMSSDDGLLKKMSMSARKKAVEKFAWRTVADSVLNVYRSLI
jgi:glycosyltransferase involved in cell wall biosynthesis